VVADHDRPEDALGAAVEQVVDQCHRDQRPQPRVPHDLAEALTGLDEHVAGGGCGDPRHPDPCEAPGGHEERGRVDRQRATRADPRHQQAGNAAAEDHRGVLAEPAHRDGLPEQRLGHRLRRDRLGARAGEGAERTVQGAARREEPERAPATEEAGRDQRLDSGGRGVRAAHHHRARQPVAEDAAPQHGDDVRECVGAHHEAEVGG